VCSSSSRPALELPSLLFVQSELSPFEGGRSVMLITYLHLGKNVGGLHMDVCTINEDRNNGLNTTLCVSDDSVRVSK